MVVDIDHLCNGSGKIAVQQIGNGHDCLGRGFTRSLSNAWSSGRKRLL
jgi:hypothetical protein